MKPVTEDSVAAGVRAALPFAAADWLEGVAFGVIAAGIGLRPAPAAVMSATAFSGSAQFATLTVLRDHGSLLAVLAAVVALNSRYVAYGASLAPALSSNPFVRAAQSQLVTDVSWALSLRTGQPRRSILLGAGATSLTAWTAGSGVGAYGGSVVGDYRTTGLDAALPAFFTCLLLERIGGDGAGAAKAIVFASLAIGTTLLAPLGTALLLVLALALLGRR
jgi:predicted branched-subunit amino acid permease